MFCTECGAYSTGRNTFRKLAAPCRPNPKGAYAQQTKKLYEGKLRPGLKKWPMHHNHPCNKRIHDYHYYPDTDRTAVQHAGGDPRGLTTTGRQAADKVRDLRLRRNLTGTTTKPKRPEAGPVKPQGWVAPDWILKALAESGDTHSLDEAPVTKPRASRDTDYSGTASSSADPPPKRAKTSDRRESETLSLSQAVEAYYASDIDSSEESKPDAVDSAPGDPQDPSTAETEQQSP